MKRVFAIVVVIGAAGILLMIGLVAVRVFRQINQRHLKTELVYAIVRNDATSVRSLLHEGVNPNAAATYTNGGGFFAMLRSGFRSSQVIKGIYPAPLVLATSCGMRGTNPWAMIAGPEVIAALLDAGANPNIRTDEGYSPLDHAALAGDPTSVQTLLDHGADVNVEIQEGYTPLTCAIYSGNVDIVRSMLHHGAKPNARTRDGFRPLIDASNLGKLPLVMALLAAGADPKLKSKDGYTALDYEDYYGSKSYPQDYREIKRLLERK